MLALTALDRWLYQVLSGDATLSGLVGGRIYNTLAPQDAAMPFVVFNVQASGDTYTLGPTALGVDTVYQVKCIAPSRGVAEPVLLRLDELLSAQSGTSTATVRILAVMRTGWVSYTEYGDGVRYEHVGGLWRVSAAPA